MSLKSRIQKNRRSKSSSTETDTDLLEFFGSNKKIDVLHLYSASNIYEEKNNTLTKSDFSFSSQAIYVDEIQKISELYGNMPSSSNPEAILNISDEITIKIFVPPVISEGVYTVISRKKGLSDSKNIIISNEIILYLKECLKQKRNVFVEGDASVSKAPLLTFLSDILNENTKTVIYDKNNEIKSKKPCSVRISDFYKNIREIPFDNIFINEADTNELIKIFELVIGGFKGFVVSLSLKNNSDILASLRNMLLLASPNLFEENADFMSVSSVDVIVSVNKNPDGNIIISKISEIFENNDGHSVKDIFVFDESGSHISTGNRSKFFNKINSPQVFSAEYFKENYTHSYSEEENDNENIQKNIEETENIIVSEEETKDKEVVKSNFEKIFETKDLSTQINEETNKNINDNKKTKNDFEEIFETKELSEQISEKTNKNINDNKKTKSNFDEILENTYLSTQLNEDKAEDKPEDKSTEKVLSNIQEFIPDLNTVLNKSEEIIDIKEQKENNDLNNEIATVIDNTEQNTVSEIVEPLSKKEKLKKKLKENKKKKTSKTENFEASEENDVSPVIQTQSDKPTEENIIIEDFESEIKKAEEEEFTVKNNKKPYIEIFEETDDSSNEGALASETDDFQIETENIPPSETKITNILEDYEKYSSNENTAEISEDYSQYYVEEENKTAPDPELFAEIKDVDVNNTPDETFEIEDENI